MTAVTLPPGTAHGTPEGHTAGCNHDRKDCPALAEHGMSCTIAHVRAMTDPRYYRFKARDPRPAAIARALGITPPTTAERVYDAQHDRRRIEGSIMPGPTPPANPRAKKKPTTQPAPAPAPPEPAAAERPHLALADFTRGLTVAKTYARGREIRDWLRTHGHPTLSNKGIIPSDLLHEYLDAHPAATDPAQPLAERPQDPSDHTPAPADEVAAATPTQAPAEGEGMGHTPAAPDRDESGDLDDAELDEIAQQLVDETAREHGIDIAHRSDQLDETRARIDEPTPTLPRPEWADITSEDVTKAQAAADIAIAERDRARSLTARLWAQLETTEQRAHTAENALDLTLQKWALAESNLTEHRARLRGLIYRLVIEREDRRAAWARADAAEKALDELRAAVAAIPEGATVAPIIQDGHVAGIRLTPTRRPLTWKRNAR